VSEAEGEAQRGLELRGAVIAESFQHARGVVDASVIVHQQLHIGSHQYGGHELGFEQTEHIQCRIELGCEVLYTATQKQLYARYRSDAHDRVDAVAMQSFHGVDKPGLVGKAHAFLVHGPTLADAVVVQIQPGPDRDEAGIQSVHPLQADQHAAPGGFVRVVEHVLHDVRGLRHTVVTSVQGRIHRHAFLFRAPQLETALRCGFGDEKCGEHEK